MDREEEFKNIINDLTLALEMWINGYPFDEDHKAKQRDLINKASDLIGKPKTIEDIGKMIDPDVEYMLDICLKNIKNESGLKFIESLKEWYDDNHYLTQKQKQALIRWYDNIED